MPTLQTHTRFWQTARVVAGAAVLVVLAYTYSLGADTTERNPFNYFGYFTNLTALLTASLLIVAGTFGVTRWVRHDCFVVARAVATTCMVIVGVIYNTLVPGTGSAPVWVSVTLHLVLPAFIVLDWIAGPGRRALPWSRVWWVLPYPIAWVAVVLARGVTDGWVPYGFLLPSRGMVSLVVHLTGLLAALTAVGVLVWWTSRLPQTISEEQSGLAPSRRE